MSNPTYLLRGNSEPLYINISTKSAVKAVLLTPKAGKQM